MAVETIRVRKRAAALFSSPSLSPRRRAASDCARGSVSNSLPSPSPGGQVAEWTQTARVITHCSKRSNGYPAHSTPGFLRRRVAGWPQTARVERALYPPGPLRTILSARSASTAGHPATAPPPSCVRDARAQTRCIPRATGAPLLGYLGPVPVCALCEQGPTPTTPPPPSCVRDLQAQTRCLATTRPPLPSDGGLDAVPV